MCEISQDLRGICAVALVRRAHPDNLQSFVPFKLCCCSLMVQLWMGFCTTQVDGISLFSLGTCNIGEVPYEVSVYQFCKKTLKLMAQ